MIDIHAHILFGVDDGATTMEESIAILKEMAKLGFEKVIATPHYMKNTDYIVNNKKKKEILKDIKLRLEAENIPIEVYLGNEVFIEEGIINKIKNQDIYTLNQTNYILIELPLFEKMHADLDILFKLVNQGVRVILAHPERYAIFQKKPKLINKYLDMGILFQGNMYSIMGKYGKNARKLSLELLKNHKYFVLGSDIHHADVGLFKTFPRLRKKIIKITDEDYFNELTEINPRKVIEGRYD